MNKSQTPTTAFENAFAKWEKQRTQATDFVFSQDVYSLAFIASFSLMKHTRRSESPVSEDLGFKFITTGLMLLAVFVQLVASRGVYNYVHTVFSHRITYAVEAAKILLIGSNMTMPIGLSERICGQFEQPEMTQGELSQVVMPDQTVYTATTDSPLFYTMKMPGLSWSFANYQEERSILEDILLITSESINLSPFSDAGYSVLFILMAGVFFCSIMVELRDISHFNGMLLHFMSRDVISNAKDLPVMDAIEKEDGSVRLRINRLIRMHWVIGFATVFFRLVIALCIAGVGAYLLCFTFTRLDLILNSLALVFLLELDTVMYLGIAGAMRQDFLQDIETINLKHDESSTRTWIKKQGGIFTIFCFAATLFVAVLLRLYQLYLFDGYFNQVAAMCLFAGPTPFDQKDVLSPATGMCESLLSVRCAPQVTGPGQKHGHCIVTDQVPFKPPSIKLYLDDPSKPLFLHTDSEGVPSHWKEWVMHIHMNEDEMREELQDVWYESPKLNFLRQSCLLMYQPLDSLDTRVVDQDSGEVMEAAPFTCQKSIMFDDVFDVPHDAQPTIRLMDDTFMEHLGQCRRDQQGMPRNPLRSQQQGIVVSPKVFPGHAQQIQLRHPHLRQPSMQGPFANIAGSVAKAEQPPGKMSVVYHVKKHHREVQPMSVWKQASHPPDGLPSTLPGNGTEIVSVYHVKRRHRRFKPLPAEKQKSHTAKRLRSSFVGRRVALPSSPESLASEPRHTVALQVEDVD